MLVNSEMVLKHEKRLSWNHSVRMAQYAATERFDFTRVMEGWSKEQLHWMQRHTEWVQAHYKMHHVTLFPAERYMTLSLLYQALYFDLIDMSVPATRHLASAFISIHSY